MHRIGLLLPAIAGDAEFQSRVGASCRRWRYWAGPWPQREDRNSLGCDQSDDIRRHAAELIALDPDVILCHGSPTLGPHCSGANDRTMRTVSRAELEFRR